MQKIISELELLGLNPYYRYPELLHLTMFPGWRLERMIEEYGVKIKVHYKPIQI